MKVKGFSLYGGAGLVAGKSHTVYDRAIANVITEHDDVDVLIGGFKLCTNIEYQISSHLHVYADYTYNGIVSTDWSTRYTNTLFGIGIDYSLKPFDDD